MPPLPEGAEGEAVRRGIIDGHLPLRRRRPEVATGDAAAAILCFSGPMWQVAMEAQRILAERYGVAADAWAVTSWTELRTDALEVERWNRLHPEAEPRTADITAALGAGPDPVVAITDYMRAVPDQVARFVDRPYVSLGTDGFGRSDARAALRSLLRGRRGPPGRRRAAAARPERAARALRRGRGHRRVRHRRRRRAALHASEHGGEASPRTRLGASWAPSGTARRGRPVGLRRRA